jgi:hypothetical protein
MIRIEMFAVLDVLRGFLEYVGFLLAELLLDLGARFGLGGFLPEVGAGSEEENHLLALFNGGHLVNLSISRLTYHAAFFKSSIRFGSDPPGSCFNP